MLKMNDLAKLSNTPKSTILYYVKEGLLPEPLKDKPNFHLYDGKCVQLIEFIKYVQTNFSATISQIKALFLSAEFDLANPYESLTACLGIIMGAENAFSVEQLCQEFMLTAEQLENLVEEGLLSPRNGIFTAKEREILAIFCRSNEAEKAMLKNYLATAKALAEQEVALARSVLASAEQKDDKLKHLFDMILVAKPYLLNMQTFNLYQAERSK